LRRSHNIEHPTSNAEHRIEARKPSALFPFDVGCSVFDGFLPEIAPAFSCRENNYLHHCITQLCKYFSATEILTSSAAKRIAD
jgi:hypothetical protein